jgi:hypothetical protein
VWVIVGLADISRAACVVGTGYCCTVAQVEDRLEAGEDSIVARQAAASAEDIPAVVVMRSTGRWEFRWVLAMVRALALA